MKFSIRKIKREDWSSITDIYVQGIRMKTATFQTEAPEYEEWDKSHMEIGRFVAVSEEGEIAGWVALSPTSSRCVYRGVAEVSVYISEKFRKCGVGYGLMMSVIEESEKEGIWTLQSGIIATNKASIALHKKCGFRVVGVREKIAQDRDGIWQDTVLMEKRSQKSAV